MIVHRYGLRMRPLQGGAQPRGFIPDPASYRATPDWDNPDTRHGWVDYPEPLSVDDVEGYELVPLGAVERTDRETEYWESNNPGHAAVTTSTTSNQYSEVAS